MPYKNPEKAKQYFSEHYKKKKELRATQARANYLKNKDKYLERAKKTHLKNTYNLSIEEYNTMLKCQGGVCAICKQPETSVTKTGALKPLAVDHCHTTNKVRGLLCNACNCMLGFAKDTPSILYAGIDYLKTHIQPDRMRW